MMTSANLNFVLEDYVPQLKEADLGFRYQLALWTERQPSIIPHDRLLYSISSALCANVDWPVCEPDRAQGLLLPQLIRLQHLSIHLRNEGVLAEREPTSFWVSSNIIDEMSEYGLATGAHAFFEFLDIIGGFLHFPEIIEFMDDRSLNLIFRELLTVKDYLALSGEVDIEDVISWWMMSQASRSRSVAYVPLAYLLFYAETLDEFRLCGSMVRLLKPIFKRFYFKDEPLKRYFQIYAHHMK
jgi:hypothetical protein